MHFNIAMKRSHILCEVSVRKMISIIREKMFMSSGGKTSFSQFVQWQIVVSSVAPGSSFTLVLSLRSPTVTVTVSFLMAGLGPVACERRCGKETVQSAKELSSRGVSPAVSCSAAVTVEPRWPCPRGVQAELGEMRPADEGSRERILPSRLLSAGGMRVKLNGL